MSNAALVGAATAMLVGLAVGSFLNVVADRVPRNQSLLAPRSHCDSCGRALGWRDLVPVVGYLWLSGRCRHCGAAIGRRVLIMEMGGALIAGAAWVLYGTTAPGLLAAVFGWVFLVMSVMDIEQRKVYGVVVLPALAVAVLAAPWWPPAGGLVGALIAAAVCVLPYAAAYLVAQRIYDGSKGMGLGDVKAAALMGLLAGWPGALIALVVTAVAGGLVAMALLVGGKMQRRGALPTVPLFALGALAAVLWHSGLLPLP